MPTDNSDDAQLASLGYAQQLLRELGGFSSFAISFSTISILTGAVTLYGHGLRFGGPWVMTAGWPLVTVMTCLVAAALAQLASAYPTAGALYHWAAILGGRGWGYLTAGLNALALFSIIAGVDYGLADFARPMLGLPDARWATLSVYAVMLLMHGALNHVGVRIVSALNTISAWYHVGAAALLIAALGALAPRQPVSFLTRHFTTRDGPYAIGFLIGLLQAQWTFTGYEASAHVSEETHDASRAAPRGILLSVILSGVVGYALLLAVTLGIGDLPTTAAAENPFITVLTGALGERLGNAMVWLCIGAMWFCGLAAVTSSSRMLFAFARDGGTPGSAVLARVSERWRVPHWGIWVSVAAAFLIAIWSEAYAAIVALSTLAFYAAYGIPIALELRARWSGRAVRRGPWHLGRASPWVSSLALLWIAFISVLFVMPPNALAGYTFAACLALLGLDWWLRARRSFAGPPGIAP